MARGTGTGNGNGKGRAREGRPVRARKAEAAWRFKKKETLHTSLPREVTVIIPAYLPYSQKYFFSGWASFQKFFFSLWNPPRQEKAKKKRCPAVMQL